MAIPLPQTALQDALATKEHGTANFKNATETSARLTPMDTFIHLMAQHTITKELVNTFWPHHVTMMILQ